jgi:hypothetical protein
MRGTRALGAAGLVVVLAVAPACSPSASDEPETGEPSTAPSSATPPESTGPALDPAFAMDPPGPRVGPIEASDMIVIGTAAFTEDDVAAVSGIEGVRRVVQFSQAQVPIENRLVNIAAVDPATYRNFTPYDAAETQAVWDRVAAGEMAVVKSLEKRLPLDANGFVKLGVKNDAPFVHVGAYAPQIPLVDAVVNEKWGAALEDQGMVLGNALLVSTLPTDPKTLRKDVQQALGSGASVQLTDVASQNGIDPAVQQTAVVVGTVSEVVGTFNYTVLGGGRIAPEASWVASHIDTREVPILGTVTCNVYIFPQLRAALEEIVTSGLGGEIHPNEYAGCYYPRFIAGSTTLSNHSFGLALDLNVPGNLRGTVGEIDRGVVAIFKKWGFAWGGDWGYTDPMHFEMNRLVEPR